MADVNKRGFAHLKVPIGPSHPALEEPARFLFEVEGEKVIDVDYEIGFNHRSIERLCQERPFSKIVYLVERICGICSHAHPLNHVERVEDIADIEVPERAKYIRTIYAELERIHSHMLWAGIAGEEIGYHTLFMYTWREREKVLDLFEALSGNRVMHGCNRIGGVKWNISEEQARSALGALTYLDTAADKIAKAILKDGNIAERCKGVGSLSKEDAIRLGAVGPNARASGVPEDTRVMCKYAAYGDFDLEPQTAKDGDVVAQVLVRLAELKQSIWLTKELFANLPDGLIQAEYDGDVIPPGRSVGRVEAPRGELIHYVETNGTNFFERIKIRSPTLANIPSYVPKLIGCQVADIPIIAASIDPCFSCTDRMTVIKDGKRKIVSGRDLKAGRV
ncbi:MAG: nickel-dependent hydrogenase large subunit [Euryarchaeota archaeon]